LKKTPLNDWHRAHGASMVDFGGWDMPVSYGPIGAEHVATRQAAGLFDISHMGQVLVEGPRALDFLQYVTTNDVAALSDGRMQYSLLPNEQGGLWDDIIVTRLSAQKFYVVVNASNTEPDLAWMQAQARAFGVSVSHLGGQAMFALQGPKAELILQGLMDASLTPLKYYHLREDKVAGVAAYVSRSGYTGEDGFEISVPVAEALKVWEALLQAGSALGMKVIGLGARNTLRLEMAYALYGHEIDDKSNAYEAGLGWVVKPAKGDFVGKAALVAKKDAPARKLVGFELIDRGVARDGYPVLDANGTVVGQVTSGGPSPSLDNKCIGLAYVPAALAAVGTELGIDVRGRALKARVVKPPFVASHVKKS
jgi:aminomethyltransferase